MNEAGFQNRALIVQKIVNAIILIALVQISLVNLAIAKEPREIAEEIMPSVVSLVMEDSNHSPVAMGSGFVLYSGVVVTNYHVIQDASYGAVKLPDNHRSGGRVFEIEGVLAARPELDLVLLWVHEMFFAGGNGLPLANIDKVAVGDPIYAAGSPQGLEGTFSQGIVSGIRSTGKEQWFQITAPISPGSSGGPILNDEGEVIGVATKQLLSGQNLNFAIPSSYISEMYVEAGGKSSVLELFSDTKSPQSLADFAKQNAIKENTQQRSAQGDDIGPNPFGQFREGPIDTPRSQPPEINPPRVQSEEDRLRDRYEEFSKYYRSVAWRDLRNKAHSLKNDFTYLALRKILGRPDGRDEQLHRILTFVSEMKVQVETPDNIADLERDANQYLQNLYAERPSYATLTQHLLLEGSATYQMFATGVKNTIYRRELNLITWQQEKQSLFVKVLDFFAFPGTTLLASLGADLSFFEFPGTSLRNKSIDLSLTPVDQYEAKLQRMIKESRSASGLFVENLGVTRRAVEQWGGVGDKQALLFNVWAAVNSAILLLGAGLTIALGILQLRYRLATALRNPVRRTVKAAEGEREYTYTIW